MAPTRPASAFPGSNQPGRGECPGPPARPRPSVIEYFLALRQGSWRAWLLSPERPMRARSGPPVVPGDSHCCHSCRTPGPSFAHRRRRRGGTDGETKPHRDGSRLGTRPDVEAGRRPGRRLWRRSRAGRSACSRSRAPQEGPRSRSDTPRYSIFAHAGLTRPCAVALKIKEVDLIDIVAVAGRLSDIDRRRILEPDTPPGGGTPNRPLSRAPFPVEGAHEIAGLLG